MSEDVTSVMRAVVGAKRIQEPGRTREGRIKGYWILELKCGHKVRQTFEGLLPSRPAQVRCRRCSWENRQGKE